MGHQTFESHLAVIEREAGAPAVGENDRFVLEREKLERGFFGPIRSSDVNSRAFHLAIVLRLTPCRLARTMFVLLARLDRSSNCLGSSSHRGAFVFAPLGLVFAPLAFPRRPARAAMRLSGRMRAVRQWDELLRPIIVQQRQGSLSALRACGSKALGRAALQSRRPAARRG